MNDLVLSYIRTWVPVGAGAGLSWLAVKFGIGVPKDIEAELAVGLTALVVAAYYALVRALEKRYPWVGRWLIGAGAKSKPAYVEVSR